MVSDTWLALLQAAQPSSKVWFDALKSCGSAEALHAESARALLALGLPAEGVSKLHRPDEALLERWRRWLAGPNRGLVTFGSALYPPRLAEIQTAPLALWVEGPDHALLSAPQLAMVGSRSPTTTGRETAEQFAKYLSARGLTITSGLATGIDGASHRGALPELGGTLAVLGSGPDVIFPRGHERLAADIVARGLLVSEFARGVEPQKFFFPQRNRVIAGLAVGTLVVEATRRSGSLITARWAGDFGREVFAIPGSIHNPLARGCHWLIRQGAKLVQLDLAEAAPAATPDSAEDGGLGDDPMYRKLLNAMDFSPVAIGDLGARVQLTAAELSSMLLILELEGLVEALPGGRYARLGKRK